MSEARVKKWLPLRDGKGFCGRFLAAKQGKTVRSRSSNSDGSWDSKSHHFHFLLVPYAPHNTTSHQHPHRPQEFKSTVLTVFSCSSFFPVSGWLSHGRGVGRKTTNTAECEYNAGTPSLSSCTGETGVATATATGITATVAVARGRRRHGDGVGTDELFYR